MNGKDFRARVRLSTADDETLALAGETCDHVDPASLPWLLRDGLIEPTEAVEALRIAGPWIDSIDGRDV